MVENIILFISMEFLPRPYLNITAYPRQTLLWAGLQNLRTQNRKESLGTQRKREMGHNRRYTELLGQQGRAQGSKPYSSLVSMAESAAGKARTRKETLCNP